MLDRFREMWLLLGGVLRRLRGIGIMVSCHVGRVGKLVMQELMLRDPWGIGQLRGLVDLWESLMLSL